MRVVYLGSGALDAGRRFLRAGEAGLLALAADGGFDTEVRVQLSPNSAHALIGHGVVELLNALPLEGTLGAGAPAVIPPASLEAARAIFYEADRKTYGGEWEFRVGAEGGSDPVEYRLRIENREYQVTLVRLVDLTTRASRHGHAVWLQLEAPTG
jgi:hypothetical protein